MAIMISSTLTAVSVAVVLLATAPTGFSTVVNVQLPRDLNQPFGYDHREALFGIPPYGGSIQSNVIYAGPDEDSMCSPIPPSSSSNWNAPFILMVDRGGCTFVRKVRNAQHAGASAVIIADNICQCKHSDVCISANTCETHEPIMADDGSGSDITIPSVLLFKQDADPIKEALMNQKTVWMDLSWSSPNPDDHVEWELWTSPTDSASRQFMTNEFRVAMEVLGQRATFTPHMFIRDGLYAGCRTVDGTSECYNLCTNVGRYCHSDPDNDLNFGISGADVVEESLRRLCIWQLYGVDDGVGLPWWDYVLAFQNNCDSHDHFMKEECIKNAMVLSNIDYDSVEQCMVDSGGLESPGVNTILQQQLYDKAASGIVIMPALYINGVFTPGGLEFATVFRAICSGFAPGTEPDVCEICARSIDEEECVLTYQTEGEHSDHTQDDDIHDEEGDHDDCDLVTADATHSNITIGNATNVYSEMELTCPDGQILIIDLSGDNIKNQFYLQKQLPKYCRENCNSTFADTHEDHHDGDEGHNSTDHHENDHDEDHHHDDEGHNSTDHHHDYDHDEGDHTHNDPDHNEEGDNGRVDGSHSEEESDHSEENGDPVDVVDPNSIIDQSAAGSSTSTASDRTSFGVITMLAPLYIAICIS